MIKETKQLTRKFRNTKEPKKQKNNKRVSMEIEQNKKCNNSCDIDNIV